MEVSSLVWLKSAMDADLRHGCPMLILSIKKIRRRSLHWIKVERAMEEVYESIINLFIADIY